MRELGVVLPAAPCRSKWESLPGDDRVRFCRGCKQNVYDLSSLSTDEARNLLAEEEGRLCVRFWARSDGRLLPRDCRRGRRRRVLRRLAVGATLLAIAAGALRVATWGPPAAEATDNLCSRGCCYPYPNGRPPNNNY